MKWGENDSSREECERLVLDNLGVVHSIVKKFVSNPALPLYQELYSEGVTGLLEAARRHQPEKGKFVTFAYYRVQGAILNFLQSKVSLIRVPRRSNKSEGAVAPTIVSLSGKQGEDAGEGTPLDIPTEDGGYAFIELTETIKKLLTEFEYTILMMKYEGHSQVEIGQILGKSDATISKTVVGIRRKLKPILMDGGI